MQVRSLVIKHAVRTHGKLQPLLVERDQRQHMQKSHPLFIKTAVTTYGNPSTAY